MVITGVLVRTALSAVARLTGERNYIENSPDSRFFFETVNFCELYQQDRLRLLAECYRQGFGAQGDGEWGEGWNCPESPLGADGHTILSLAAHGRLLETGVTKPICVRCGAELVLCYPDHQLFARFERELQRNEWQEPLVVLMYDRRAVSSTVVGFSYGAVMSLSHLVKTIVEERYKGREKLGQQELGFLQNRLGLPNSKRVLFIHEILILTPYRGQVDNVRFLVRPIFAHGKSLGVKKALFWSAAFSKIVPQALYMGFEKVFEADGLVYLYTSNFESLLKIAQYFNASLLRKIFYWSGKLQRMKRKKKTF